MVANGIEHQSTLTAHRIFEGSYCESLSYFIRTKKKNFDIDGFTNATGSPSPTADREWHSVTCAPQNQASDYHLHVSWRIATHFELRVAFVKGAKQPAPDEREPYAEQFMEWIEKFFIAKNPDSHIHSDFKFPSGVRQSKFLLPLKATFGPAGTEVEIDGISFTLKPEPQGITKIWLTQEGTRVLVNLTAERQLDFKNFDPKNQIEAFTSVLDSILEGKK